jgi:hypothetical protein
MSRKTENNNARKAIPAPGAEPSEGTVHVSITGLTLKSRWFLFRFYWHALRSFRQARKTPGNLHASVRVINGVQHTLTVWEDRRAMARFAFSGAHKRAIKAFPDMATGKTYGFESSTIPDWDEVHALWLAHAVDYSASADR